MTAIPSYESYGAATEGITVSSICFDSRQVKANSLFAAVVGTQVDGHQYIQQAIENGAIAVLCEVLPDALAEGVVYLVVEDAAKALGFAASSFFGHPSKKLKLVAITGTNGKTTVATLLYQLFRQLGYHAGLLSTVENKVDDEVLDAKYTTPDAVTLNQLLAEMVQKGCTHCFMEASSHAIHQERMAGLEIAGAVFTNISHDHLDYHKTFDAYIKAKKKLFDGLNAKAFALTNLDDRRGMVMLQNCVAEKHTFSLRSISEYKARILDNTFDGLLLDINGTEAWFRLIGRFNGYNLLATYAVAILMEEDKEEVLRQLSLLAPARGRFEQVVSPQKIRGIVDYAHTPDALENVLTTIESLRNDAQQVITVVGCGGNRDKNKRPEMGKIAAKMSDRVVFTSDNPRDEEPEQIIEEMRQGVQPMDVRKVLAIEKRPEAIKTAVALANPEDIVLVAGKGHETYQEIKGVRYPMDDKKILLETFQLN